MRIMRNMDKVYALGRLRRGTMNGMEKDYDDYLKCLHATGEVIWHKFEGLKFRLADNTFYTPDFAVMRHDGLLEMHEVKGFWIGDARAKIKIAAELYPFIFFVVTGKKNKYGGKKSFSDWSFEQI